MNKSQTTSHLSFPTLCALCKSRTESEITVNSNIAWLVSPTGSDQVLDEAEQLIWSLLDDDLPEEDIPKLESLIMEHTNVRKAYVHCVLLHAYLSDHFGKPISNEAQRVTTTIDPVCTSHSFPVPWWQRLNLSNPFAIVISCLKRMDPKWKEDI